LQHVKDPYNGVEFAIVGKITGNFSSIVPPFPARGLPCRRHGGTQQCKWELPKCRVSTISLQAAVHPGALAAGGPIEEEEESGGGGGQVK
jgi:hypothetical protein